ncbi:hypothetical protein LCGC14_0355310 [marine sediment metagenome]|uniref:Uncharacterized protein n=1 Tax=marine sediment metagenome TaxID=412755 RepID=A0A0F9VWY0_9ZZZZ
MPRNAANRKERIPLGGRRQKMAAPERLGYHRHWFNDIGNRLADCKAAGYTFVNDKETLDETQGDEVGTRKCMVVGTQESGQPLYAYLMELPQKLYDEDQAAKQVDIDEMEAAMKSGQTPGHESLEHSYIPDEGISIKR